MIINNFVSSQTVASSFISLLVKVELLRLKKQLQVTFYTKTKEAYLSGSSGANDLGFTWASVTNWVFSRFDTSILTLDSTKPILKERKTEK